MGVCCASSLNLMPKPKPAEPTKHHIVVVDPELDFIQWVKKHLEAPDVSVTGFSDPEKALVACKAEPPSLVIAEYVLKPYSGLDLLKKLKLQTPSTLVILTAGSPPNPAVIDAMRLGGYDFLRKSSLHYELRPVVESALQTIAEMASEPQNTAPVDPDSGSPGDIIIGESSAMQDVLKLIGRVSRSDAPVLITGESGCGKEVVARAVHRFSPRSSKPFVAINCAAIPETLLESELFGHEKGAFTGAMQQRIGRFEQGNGGTLFLDEIGEMPIMVQSKLLRVLQEGEFSRVGGNQTLKSNVRIVAATNRDPEKSIAAGQFREDLYYRLNVVRIHIPPLRERVDDIMPLAEHFRKRIGRGRSGPALRFSLGAMRVLQNYNWPGNVRELENVVQRAAVLATGNIIMPRDLPLAEHESDRVSDSAAHVRRVLRTFAASVLDYRGEQKDASVLIDQIREMLANDVAKHTSNDIEAAKALGLTKAAWTKLKPTD